MFPKEIRPMDMFKKTDTIVNILKSAKKPLFLITLSVFDENVTNVKTWIQCEIFFQSIS